MKPATAITTPSALTPRRRSRGCDPSAGRIPNSRVCELTENASTPATPIKAIDNATAARLVGFVGKDAEVKTTKTQREFTVLSLATTASWKGKNGDGYIRRTEWHKLVAWGNLSTFAATLKKGAHVSVEGELRYREFVPKEQKKQKNGDHKIRIAEIHLSKIAKLDRAEKHDPNAPPPDLPTSGAEAPF